MAGSNFCHPKDKSWSSFDSPVAVQKHARFFNIVVADKRTRRDGRFIERIGFYNPIATANEESIRIAQDRLTYWQGVGAQASPTVERLINQAAKKAANKRTAVEGGSSALRPAPYAYAHRTRTC
jgi:small subunit ribosomal protein S16